MIQTILIAVAVLAALALFALLVWRRLKLSVGSAFGCCGVGRDVCQAPSVEGGWLYGLGHCADLDRVKWYGRKRDAEPPTPEDADDPTRGSGISTIPEPSQERKDR